MRLRLPFRKDRKTVSVVRLNGLIATGRGLNDAGLAPVFEKAFAKKPDAVALVINSPGGSPVQSSLIGARIRRLADEKDVPVVAFVEDVAASGGYWLAAAADEIFVDPSSVIGSIGVISSGFGFHDLIQNYGVERRVYTAGTSKSQMDPFKPENPEDVERLKGLLNDIHDTFKTHITSRRSGKLADRDLFTGEIWVGQKGVDDGLADGIGHLVPMMNARFGDKVRFKVFGPKKRALARFGLSIFNDAVHGIEERAAFARFGM
ncbi:MAG: S49 family peptidase [Pseudomonadota bacterium]